MFLGFWVKGGYALYFGIEGVVNYWMIIYGVIICKLRKKYDFINSSKMLQ